MPDARGPAGNAGTVQSLVCLANIRRNRTIVGLKAGRREGRKIYAVSQYDGPPLDGSSILDFAAEIHADARVISARVEGDMHRYTYADAHRKVSRLAHALRQIGIKDGDRVATLAWNGYRTLNFIMPFPGLARFAIRSTHGCSRIRSSISSAMPKTGSCFWRPASAAGRKTG